MPQAEDTKGAVGKTDMRAISADENTAADLC
jgi:hypothetical protein